MNELKCQSKPKVEVATNEGKKKSMAETKNDTRILESSTF